MMRYSVQPRDRIFAKCYLFLSLARNMSKNTGKNISKTLSGKYSQTLLDCAKQSATNAFKTVSKKEIQKTREATGDLIGNKTADKTTKVSKNSQQKNSETATNERDIYPQKIIDDQTLIKWYNNGIPKNNKFVRQYVKSTN